MQGKKGNKEGENKKKYNKKKIYTDEKIKKGKKQKEWFHPGSIRGPSPRQDDVITNYTMKPF